MYSVCGQLSQESFVTYIIMPCYHTTPAGIASDIHNKYADERDRLTWIFYYKLTSSES